MAELTVLIATHHFVVTRITPRGRAAVDTFARRFVQYGLQRAAGNRYVRTALKVFAAATEDRTEYRFHINTLKDFYDHLKIHQLEGNLIDVIQRPIKPAKKVELKVFSKWEDREYQIPFINYLVNPDPPRLKLGAIQTGKGKSYSAMRAMSIIGELVLTIVKPKYLEKWVEDYRRTYDMAIEDLMVVRGSEHLMALLLLAQNDELDCKVILVSNKTLQNWLKLYEKFKDYTLQMGYACLPDEFCETLRAGVKLVDEVHEDFHLNFKIDLYTHVEHSISLSATLLPDDPFLKNMCEIAYPATQRYVGEAYHKYIAARAVVYRTRDPRKIRWKSPGQGTYSHHVFEDYIQKHSDVLQNYLKLIDEVFKGGYLSKRKVDQRCLIFCASVEMCTLVRDYLTKLYPHLDIRRYCGSAGDPYEDLIEPDVCISTLQSAGTGVDIPGLLTVILTVAITSSQGNVQGFGRLRELTDGSMPHFFYFVCEDCDKHIQYHEKKKELLRDRALSYNSIFMGNPL